MSNYYSVLGISKNATDDEIKQAYKKLAREHHPDKGGNKETFQKIHEAYETLLNPEKRSEYDNPSPSPQQFDFHQFNSFFNHHMKQIQKCSDHYYTCNVSLQDIYFGIVKKLRIKRERLCKSCLVNCNTCHGTGIITHTTQLGPMRQIIQNACSSCHGRGKKQNSQSSCLSCKSLGVIKEERLLEINIERGCENNKQYVFKEWGEQAVKPNQVPGDFIVKINIQQHTDFTRHNLDLIYSINISLIDSIIGTNIIIPHFDSPISIDTRGFGIINPNKQYTLFNKGLIHQNNTGNLHIRFIIDYPEKTLDNEEYNLLSSAFKSINL